MPILLTIYKTKVPIHVYSKSLESGAIDQAVAIADNMPVFSHVVIMPDGHQGYALPIGGVLPLYKAIAPYCVGVDVGCGMSAFKTNLLAFSIEQHDAIRDIIRNCVPVGPGSNRKEKVQWTGFDNAPDIKVIQEELNNAQHQLGTLGGGNHFIEIQIDTDGFIWAMVHSGSRHLGNEVARYYHKLAQEKGIVPNGLKDLAYFPLDSDEAQEYIIAMNFCLAFAKQSRQIMMDNVHNAMQEVLGNVEILKTVNIHHNYAASERFAGEDVIIHRKGATLASEGTIGIIPGSQASSSYIVKGKGNLDSFNSCSHGAGRVMSRAKANKSITLERHNQTLMEIGLMPDNHTSDLSESRDAYKDINEVMENQNDLVDIVTELRPFQRAAIKG